jgi:hypothetical protein
MPLDVFYSVPSSKLLLVFILSTIVISLAGMYTFDNVFAGVFGESEDTSTYISIVSIAVALITAFIVSNEWQTYARNKEALTKEADAILILIKMLESMKQNQKPTELAKQYLRSIIDVEFKEMAQGKLRESNEYLDALQKIIYDESNETEHVLYDKTVELVNRLVEFRRERIVESSEGTPKELWWMLIIGFSIIIIISWFLKGNQAYRVAMITLSAITYASMAFLVVALDFPFKGEFGLKPVAFQNILHKLKL